MTSLGLVLAFLGEVDGEFDDGTASEFPACMPSDSNLGRALALTRELLAENCDIATAGAVATKAALPGFASAAHVTGLAAMA